MAQITAELRQFFASDDNRAGLGETFARLNRTLADVDTTVNSANRLIEDAGRATQQLAPSLASSAQALAGTMQSAAHRLDALLEKQEPALDELLKQGNARLAEMKALSSLLAGYDSEKNQSIRATLENLNGASKNLEELLADLKRHPGSSFEKGKRVPCPLSHPPPQPQPRRRRPSHRAASDNSIGWRWSRPGISLPYVPHAGPSNPEPRLGYDPAQNLTLDANLEHSRRRKSLEGSEPTLGSTPPSGRRREADGVLGGTCASAPTVHAAAVRTALSLSLSRATCAAVYAALGVHD